MARIRVLSDQTINQIAAGEVIEDPASVVKELVENARDAGARSISIEVVGGGFQSISICDDGEGMSRDDAVLAFERHATSKLTCVDDLDALATMGFRGEALASIGAISRVELVTMQEEGTRVVFECGRLLMVEGAGRARGTTFTVRRLFDNVPVRKKFQKSATACQSAIVKMVVREALANPEVAYRLQCSSNVVLDVPAGNLFERIEGVLGAGFTAECRRVDYESGPLKIVGLVGKPEASRFTRSGQHLIVNGRHVVSPEIARAIQEGFATRIESRSYPIFALHLNLPPSWIDVNVHPQKREIRLRKEEAIFAALREAVVLTQVATPAVREPVKLTMPVNWGTLQEEPAVVRAKESQESLPITFEKLDVLGIVSPYLILPPKTLEFEGNEGIILVHLDRVRGRLIYQSVLKRFEKAGGGMQALLFPLTFEFAPDAAARLNENLEDMRALGIDMRLIGPTTFVVEGLAPSVSEERVKELIDLYLDRDKGRGLKREQVAELASAFALAGSKQYTVDEGRRMLEELIKQGAPLTSAKGDPITSVIDPHALF